jgi:sialidase-1
MITGGAHWAVIVLLGFVASARAQSPEALILRQLVVYEKEGEYCAWPDIARDGDGSIVVLFTRSEEHLAPDGAILLVRSTDTGETWSTPRVVFDTPLDDRESGITPLRGGRLLAHFYSAFHDSVGYASLPPLSYEPSVIRRWTKEVQSPRYQAARSLRGSWNALSRDGGRTWSEPVRGRDAVHGGIELNSGELLVASYRDEHDSLGVYTSPSPLSPWKRMATLASPDPGIRFGEPHLAELPSGRVVMMIRATAVPYNDQDPRCVLWETFSDDRGATWCAPFPTPLWGFPPDLTLLSDGRLLCTFGYRRKPFGERASLSDDGIHWGREITLRDDAPNGDLGYPASLELRPGVILTVYYQPHVPRGSLQQMHPPDPRRRKPGILGTLWRLPARKPVKP